MGLMGKVGLCQTVIEGQERENKLKKKKQQQQQRKEMFATVAFSKKYYFSVHECFAYMYVLIPWACLTLLGSEKNVRSLGIGLKDGYKTPCRC